MKKRICIVGPAYPYRGGNALFVAHLYEILSRDYDITVINYSRLYPQILFPGTRQEDISNVGIKTHPSERIIDSINPLTWKKAVKRIKELNPDLIAFIWYNPFFGICLGNIAGKLKKYFPGKILFITENVISHESRKFDRILTSRALKHADKFLVLSDIVEKEIKNLYPYKPLFRSSLPIYDCYKIDNTINQSEIREKINVPHQKKVILFFGYIREYKGLIYLINALPSILKAHKDAFLLIVGEFYDDKQKYTEKIKELGLENYVKIISEFVPNEEVGYYYSASDIVVLPYNSATQSGVLNIAYGFGKPVVVTNVGGLPELVEMGKTGYIAEPKNPESIAAQVIKFFDNPEKEEFERNIKSYIEKNNFNIITEKFKEILNN